MLRGFSLVVSLFLGVILLSPGTLTQERPAARCTNLIDFARYDNSHGEDACQVATEVGQICDISFFIPAIRPFEAYSQLGVEKELNACKCTTVFFSLLSVCSACQGADTELWDIYSANCSQTYLSTFPFQLPAGLSIPHWAYIPILANGSINVAAIQADHLPDFGDTSSSSTSGSSSASGTTPSAATTSSSVTSPVVSVNSRKRKLAGIIAGSVVGGVTVLVLLALGSWWMWKRTRSPLNHPLENEKGHSIQVTTAETPFAVAVPFTPTDPVDPRPSKGRLSAQPSFQSSSKEGSPVTITVVSEQQVDDERVVNRVHQEDVEARSSSQRGSRVTSISTDIHRLSVSPNPQRGSTGSESQEVLENQLREMQVQVDRLTTEVSRYMEPPAYEERRNQQ